MRNQRELVHPDAAVAPGYLANHAAKVFNRLVDDSLRKHGVSLALLGPILLLSWKGPMLQRDLVRASAIKQPAMVALLDKLQTMKLVERQMVPEDRRAAMVQLTRKGRIVAQLGGDALIDANRKGLEDFSEAETMMLVGLLQRLIANMEKKDGTKYHV